MKKYKVAFAKQQLRTSTRELIPRPPGESGKAGWKLIRHMGLAGNKEKYNEIMVSQGFIGDNLN